MYAREPFVVNDVVGEFGSFLQSQNIAGLTIGFLIGTSTLDMSKSLVAAVVMPVVAALRGMRAPPIDLLSLYEPVLTFVLTLFVCFVILKLGNIAPKPIQLVQVINPQPN